MRAPSSDRLVVSKGHGRRRPTMRNSPSTIRYRIAGTGSVKAICEDQRVMPSAAPLSWYSRVTSDSLSPSPRRKSMHSFMSSYG